MSSPRSPRSWSWLVVAAVLLCSYACTPAPSDIAAATADLTSGTLLYAFSSSCSGQPVAAIGPETNCDTIPSSDWIGSVKIGSECVSISSTDARTACTRFGGSVILYEWSSFCSGSVAGIVGPKTDCNALGVGSVGSVRINGECIDIPDGPTRDACLNYAGDVLFYEFTDSCDSTPLAALGAGTECSRFPESRRISSVRLGGECVDIAETNMRDACTRYVPGSTLCVPRCSGLECGSDGCGGSCGTCGDHEGCVGGSCVYIPDCRGRDCGGDGCGGSCGTCGATEACQAGVCTCVPRCNGATCGPDGCGGQCGECGDWETCTQGRCRANPPPPAPECSHGLCESGVPLTEACDSCVANVCQDRPSCCTLRWDSSCKQIAQSKCGIRCP